MRLKLSLTSQEATIIEEATSGMDVDPRIIEYGMTINLTNLACRG